MTEMATLRVVPKIECDYYQGVPLDWERCRTCKGTGVVDEGAGDVNPPGAPEVIAGPCIVCGGHGSLKAAALHALMMPKLYASFTDKVKIRCEGCGHPMSNMTWEGDLTRPPKVLRWKGTQGTRTVNHTVHFVIDGPEAANPREWESLHLEAGLSWLRVGEEPPDHATVSTPWSSCDEGCRHDTDAPTARANGQHLVLGPVSTNVREGRTIEASWRQVGVRFLNGWAHDLRPENLTLLCARCEAAR